MSTDLNAADLFETGDAGAGVEDFVRSQLPPAPARVLEVGCGSGELALALSAEGWRGTAGGPEAPGGPPLGPGGGAGGGLRLRRAGARALGRRMAGDSGGPRSLGGITLRPGRRRTS